MITKLTAIFVGLALVISAWVGLILYNEDVDWRAYAGMFLLTFFYVAIVKDEVEELD